MGTCQRDLNSWSTKVKGFLGDVSRNLNQHLSDPQTRRIATDVAKNASIEGLKFIPGAYSAYKIVSRSIDDDANMCKRHEEDLITLQAKVSKLEKEVDVLRMQLEKQVVEMKARNCNTVEASDKPEGKNPMRMVKKVICTSVIILCYMFYAVWIPSIMRYDNVSECSNAFVQVETY